MGGQTSKSPTAASRVKILDERTINQIAAGEVIERPASVVKELLENSLDANATRIELRLREGGKELVAVRDNGCGMDRGDLLLAFRKHATSKISSFTDLERVATFGFRGEALASIGSVARVKAVTRRAEDEAATRVLIEGGRLGSVQETGAPKGTLVEVVELFYNVPAREKYLKTKATELRHCLAVVTALALAHPRTAFKVDHEGRELLNVPAGGDERARLASLLGPEVARELVKVTFSGPKMKVSGWAGKPALMRKTAGAIHLFINGRPVQSVSLQRALREAYGNLLPARHYPVAVLNLQLEPSLVDVNVHPAKRWVRFADEAQVNRVLREALAAALSEQALIPNLELGRLPEGLAEQGPESPTVDFQTPAQEGLGGEPSTVSRPSLQSQLDVAARGEVLPAGTPLPPMTPLALLERKYIVARGGETLYIIDFHAAHERVMYERLKLASRYSTVASQKLLEPRTVELAPTDAALLQEHLGELETLGFEIEHFGGASFVTRSVPAILGSAADTRELADALAELAAAGKAKSLKERLEGYLNTLACHSALRAGAELTLARQQWVLNEMASIANPFSCVHGRPTMMKITTGELDRKFKRRGF